LLSGKRIFVQREFEVS